MARSAPMGGKGGGQSVPYQPAGFGQNQQFSGGFGMGTGGFFQPQFGQSPQFGGGFGSGFGMQQQPPNQLVGINYTPPVIDRRARPSLEPSPDTNQLRLLQAGQGQGFAATTGQEQLDAMQRRQLGAGFGGLGDFLKGAPAEAGRINDMRYRAPGRVLPPGRFQPFPQPGGRPQPGFDPRPQPNYNRLPQPDYKYRPPRFPPRFQQPRPQPMPRRPMPIPRPGYGNFRPRPMPGYGGFPGDYMPLPRPRPQPIPRYQPALPSRLGSPTMYEGRGFTPNYGVPRSMIPEPEYQLFDGGFF